MTESTTRTLPALEGAPVTIHPVRFDDGPWMLAVNLDSFDQVLDPSSVDYLAAILSAESTRIRRLGSGVDASTATEHAQETVRRAAVVEHAAP